jgi:serine/threonine protein kinase
MPPQANCALPEGFQLERYRIERQLSLGGFSIVYLARDETGTPVAIKEYLPNTLALRGEGEILPRVAAENLAVFRYGMKCFFEEGRALARLTHPNVVQVLNFFRANDTVYMVMAFERGRTLHDYVQPRRGEVKERFLRTTFTRLLNGLREVHAHKLLHLDIKPSNIWLRTDGTPVLLDFGAARQTLSNDQPMLKPMYTPGFASPEQFAHRDALGPWTDIYSVGACLHACIVGAPPLRSDERLKADSYQPLAASPRPGYSQALLTLVDWCLRLDPLERPQSVYALQKALRPPADGAAADTEAAPGTAAGSGLGQRLRALVTRTVRSDS